MDKLLTKQDVADYLQITPHTVDEYIKEGIISPVKKLKCIRFNPQHIADISETKLEKFSPIERRRLELELEEVKKERDNLRAIINEMNVVMAKVMYQQATEKK